MLPNATEHSLSLLGGRNIFVYINRLQDSRPIADRQKAVANWAGVEVALQARQPDTTNDANGTAPTSYLPGSHRRRHETASWVTLAISSAGS